MNKLKFVVIAAITCCALNSFAQGLKKPPLDTTVFHNWPTLEQIKLSPDGFFAAYSVTGSSPKVVAKTLDERWNASYAYAQGNVGISDDSRHLVFFSTLDTLLMVRPGIGIERRIGGVSRFELCGGYLYYFKKDQPETMHVLRLDNHTEELIEGVEQLIRIPLSEKLLILTKTGDYRTLSVLPKENGQSVIVSTKGTIGQFMKAEKSSRWYFIVEDRGKRVLYRWDNSSRPAVACNNSDLPPGELTRISPDGKWVFFEAENQLTQARQDLIIWSYLDPVRRQRGPLVTDTISRRIWCYNPLNRTTRMLFSGRGAIRGQAGNNVLIENRSGAGTPDEDKWNKYSKSSLSLISLKTGRSENVSPGSTFSPLGNFLYEEEEGKYWFMELKSGRKYCVNDQVRPNAMPRTDPLTTRSFWLKDGNRMLILDNHDVWLVDARAPGSVKSLTNGYLEKHHLKFLFLEETDSGYIFSAVDLESGETGFYRVSPGNTEPVMLSMENYEYIQVANNASGHPYLFLRTKASVAPEMVISKDLKHFKVIGSVQPQANYNWLSAELHHYPGSRGRSLSGVLYKPEDFDATNKYPLILLYYQRLGDRLHKFLEASGAWGSLNIPWMVSRGYLVFVPDITTLPDLPGASGLDDITSATDYLVTLNFVDSTKIGLAGHSFGGFETTYVVAHSSRYAAAYAGAPFTDLFAMDYVGPNYVHGQDRIQKLMWEDPQTWVDNSPLLGAHRIHTPLLMMSNDEDFLWPQGAQLMNSLRRMGKPAWMLQYKGQGHTVHGEANIDLTLRMQQFFDYYLKGATLPDWMSAPGGLSGKIDEAILDTEEKKRMEELRFRKPITVKF